MNPEFFKYKDLPLNEILKIAEGHEEQENSVSSNVSVQDISNFWQINGVEYKNGIYTVDLAKQLLPSMTQDELAEYSKKAKAKGKPYATGMPLNYSIFKALYKQENSKAAEKAKEFIANQMINSWFLTLTRINYKSKGLDEVVHNYKQDDEYKIQEKIVGPDGYINEIKDKKYLKALIGTDNINEINDVFRWLVGEDAYIYRLNNKPDGDVGRVPWFGADSGRTVLLCHRDPDYSYSSLGVRVVREAHAKKI